MIDDVTIEDFNKWYEESNEGESLEKKLKKKSLSFRQKFSVEYIRTHMEKADYCLGRGSHETFCYWVERELRGLGSILGSNATKFGLYWREDEGKYAWTKKFGESENAVWEKIKEGLVEIIKAAERGDMASISSSVFPYTVRHKIYYLYNPSEDIPIFSEEHLDMILGYFDISVPFGGNQEAKKRSALYAFKSSHPLYSRMSNRKFMSFLYYCFDSELKASRAIGRNRKGESIAFQEVVDIVDVQKALPVYRKGKTNYDDVAARRSLIGKAGEELVLRFEKKRHPGYERRIKMVSLENDHLGYDILSFDDEGNEIHIEVKTKKTGGADNIDFFITDNELQRLKEDPRYVIYYVCGITKRTKTIYSISPQALERITLRPVLYRVKARIEGEAE